MSDDPAPTDPVTTSPESDDPTSPGSMTAPRHLPWCRLLVAVAVFVVAGLEATSAAANSDSRFSLHRYYFNGDLRADGMDYFLDWRVTVCTDRPARLRIRAVAVQDESAIREEWRFVRRQTAGCRRQRLRVESTPFTDGWVETRLQVAWRDERRRTRWESTALPTNDS